MKFKQFLMETGADSPPTVWLLTVLLAQRTLDCAEYSKEE